MSFELPIKELLFLFKTILCGSTWITTAIIASLVCYTYREFNVLYSWRCLSEGKKYLERINDDLIVCVVTGNLILGSLSSLTLKLQGTVNSAILV